MKEQSANDCPGCCQTIRDDSIKVHLQQCLKYKQTILKDISRLDKYAPKNIIKFLKAQIELALEVIRKLSPNQSIIQFEDFSDLQLVQVSKAGSSKQIGSDKKIAEVQVKDIGFYGARIIVCKNCERKYYENFDRDILCTIFGCWHIFCLPCINKYIDLEFVNQGGSLKCLEQKCHEFIPEEQLISLIGRQKYDLLYGKALRKMYNLIACVKCNAEFQCSEGNPKDAPKKDNSGVAIKPQHAKDYAVNRFICPTSSCKTEQCKSCQAIPYHLGMTCKEYKDRALLKKCRYCDEPLTPKNTMFYKEEERSLADICKSAQCQQSAKIACTSILSCKHPCYGYRGEKKCLPCLNEKCAEGVAELNGVNGDEYCAICYIEPLSAAPCVRSSCGHIFHVKCLKKRYQIKWLTPRIFFNFCLCPLCKKWISVPPESSIYKFSVQFKTLFDKIQGMASDRLKFQELQKTDEKLKDKSSPYYNKPKQYSMAIYAYFQCFKCKNPYFGGRKDCMAAMNEANSSGTFKAEQLICPNCCQIPVEDCPKHGKDFIQFKCKFCCSIAQWFCWGNTHFCEPCHKRQCNGDYVSKYTKDQLPKCLGSGSCPVGGNHNGNGEQKMMGCAICRNYKQNNKNF